MGDPKKSKTVVARLYPEEHELILKRRGIEDSAEKANLNIEDVEFGWIKIDGASLFFRNPKSKKLLDRSTIDFEDIFKGVREFKFKKQIPEGAVGLFDRLVFTDLHIGMDASDKGRSLYDKHWTKEDILAVLENMITHTLSYQKSKILYITDLGDYVDGFNGQTTRGGHDLVQNMSNQEVYSLGLMFKILLVEKLAPHYEHIYFRNINDDNHGGDFSFTINEAMKVYCEKVFPNVSVENQVKFIDHTLIGNRCFVTTHGKDKVHMKHGFKPKLDPKQIGTITGYLNSKNLLNKGYEIIFEKGDSHQYLFDSSSTDLFHYYNFPAASPQSNWVQTNFQEGSSGFIHFNYREIGKSINEFLYK